jgi:hypothetical protein
VKEVREKEMGADLPEPIYEFGKNMPREKKDDDEEVGERDVDSDAEDDTLPITHEVCLKGHDGHVTALGLGSFFFHCS